MRLAREYEFEKSLKIVYCALVRPILEYGCVVWDPRSANNSNNRNEFRIDFYVLPATYLKYPVHLIVTV